MRHHGREAPVGRGHRRQAAGAAVGVEGIDLGGLAVVIDIAHGLHHLIGVTACGKVGKTLAVRDNNGQAAARHALQEDAGAVQHFHHGQTRLKAVALVLREARPGLGTRNDVGQLGKHLAAVAHAQGKGVTPAKELLKLRGQAFIEGDGARPANARTQGVAVAKAPAGNDARKVLQVRPPRLQVAHVDIHRIKAGCGKGKAHFHLRVHALLAQDGHARLGLQVQVGGGHVVLRVERQVYVHAGVVGRTSGGVFAVGAGGVVALLGDFPAHGIPHLVQVFQAGPKDFLRIAPDLQLALAHVHRARGRAGFTDDVAALNQAMLTQHLHDLAAVGGANLQHRTQFFVEQGPQGQVFAAASDLLAPVFALARIHAAIGNAVAFGHQHVHVQRHANVPGKGHFGHRGQQAAVAPVVVGQDQALLAQGVYGGHQGLQIVGIVQVGRGVAALAQHLPQDGAAHAVLPPAQVDEHQRAVRLLRIELRRERAAHVVDGGKAGNDQADGRGDFFQHSVLLPLGAHGQAVLAHRDGNAQLRAQLHAHGFDGGVQIGIFTRLAARGHPVGRELDFGQFDRRGQHVGDGFGHRHAARGRGVDGRQRGALAHGHGFTLETGEVGQGDGHVGHRHLPGAHHLVAVRQAPHGAVANGDQKALARHRGVGQHVNHGFFQRYAGQVHGGQGALHAGHVFDHLGRLAQQHIHGHIDGEFLVARLHRRVFQHQLALFGGHADDGKRAALALAEGLELRQRFRGNRQHVALLAFVAPDFLGCQARFFELHGPQVKAGTAPGIVGQLGEGVGQAARAHVVNGQDGVGRALLPAVVDDLLRPALDLGVAALHRVKIQLGGIGARGHGAGRAPAHANAHAGAAQLDEQRAGGEFDFLGLLRLNHAQAAGDHDGLVVATHHLTHLLLVLAEIAGQIRAAKLVVERCAAQRAFDHDLQGAGNVRRFAHVAAPEFGHRKARQPRLGLGAPAGSALVADFAARAGRCARKGRDGRGVVVRFHLHQHMVQGFFFLIARSACLLCGSIVFGYKTLDLMAFHDGGVVGIGHDGVLGRGGLGVANHAKQRFLLRYAVDGELGIENFVAAMFAIGLGEHHQLHIRGVAPQLGEGINQVVNFVVGQGQAPGGIGAFQGGAAPPQHIDELHRRSLQGAEQLLGLSAGGKHRFGHAVVQQGGNVLALRGRQLGLAPQQPALQGDGVFGDALHPEHVQAAVAGNVRGLGGPWRNRAQTRGDDKHRIALPWHRGRLTIR